MLLFRRALLAASSLLTLPLLTGCSEAGGKSVSAFTLPIDMSYACEGPNGHTVAPENDERAKSVNQTRMCPDLPSGRQGNLFGIVLDRKPAQLTVVQINPASSKRRILDLNYFIPGYNGIPVGSDPLRILRSPDWSTFYVISAGDRQVDVLQLGSLDGNNLDSKHTTFALPGIPFDAEIIGNSLVIAAQDTPTLWAFDLATSTTAPPLHAFPTPALPAHLTAAPDGHFLLTFRDRPTVALFDPTGTLTTEYGLVPACRDGLDNDGDGATDRDDLDCRDANGDDEGDGQPHTAAPLPPPATSTATTLPSCRDGLDNDGDGKTDFPDDPACASADDDTELLAECEDGLDNDGDGHIDFPDDPACFRPGQRFERPLPQDGPFHPTFIDAGAFGRFAYILDESRAEIIVFSWSSDTNTLTRVDVNAADALPPDLISVAPTALDATPTHTTAIPAVRPLALTHQNQRNIQITETSVFGLTQSRIRGELWDRLIPPAAPNAAPTVAIPTPANQWGPNHCDPAITTACAEPALDDATWFAFGPNLDGRIQLIEAIRRGTPVHRLAQRVIDPSDRSSSVTAPRLSRRTTLVNARGEPQPGLPFIGGALEEVLTPRVAKISPAETRQFGIWPPADAEQVLNETWTLTYQGKLPDASGNLAYLTNDSVLVDSEAAFCSAGVAPGDWVQFTLPIAAFAAPALDVVLADGRSCPTLAPTHTLVEAPVQTVSERALTLDLSQARLRPELPTLDFAAIDTARLSRRLCLAAHKALDETLGLPDRLISVADLTPADLPAHLTYATRASAWALVGTRSGFLHRQRWDASTATCIIDPTLDERLTARPTERPPSAVAAYQTCPPPASQLAAATVAALAPAEDRFYNPSLGLDIFPACATSTTGAITAVPTQQDTTFTFTTTGPHQGSALTVANSALIMRVPILDFRRQQVQLDTSAKRAFILQYRLGNPQLITTFE